MNWEELLQALLELTPTHRQEKVVVFDYATNSFHEPSICVDGKPEFHLTVN